MNESTTASDADFKQWGINHFAYVNGLKQIPNSNPPAFSVSLCEPYGRAGSKNYVYYDLTIKELAPFMLLNEHQSKINDENTKVSIQFNCYNLRPRAYLYRDNKGSIVLVDGEPKLGASMRGYLSSISRLKIGDEIIYQYRDRNQKATDSAVEATPKKVANLSKKKAKSA